jgi:YVTN family beta-propeller protein
VTNQYANALTVHSLATGIILATITGFSAPNAVAVTPDGSELFVTNGNSSSVWALETSSLAIVAKIPAGLMPTSVAVSADSSTAYVTAGYGYSLTIINTTTNAVTDTLARVGIYPASVALYQ